MAMLKSRSALSRMVDIFLASCSMESMEKWCGWSSVWMSDNGGGKDTATVSMSGSNDGSESLVVALSMFVFIGVSNGMSCMVVGDGFFWELSPFPIRAEASPALYRLAKGVR